MSAHTLIDGNLLDAATHAACRSERLRMNHNFHGTPEATAHRLLNAVEPGSYLAPHRHLSADKDETLVVLRGCFGLLIFDDAGAVVAQSILRADGEVLGVHIPHGVYHTVLAFEPGSVLFSAKGGPYLPLSPEERAPWAPAESSPEAAAYLQALADRFVPA